MKRIIRNIIVLGGAAILISACSSPNSQVIINSELVENAIVDSIEESDEKSAEAINREDSDKKTFAEGELIKLPDGTDLDVNYYISQYPDIASTVGSDPKALPDHYWYYGIQEGRLPYDGAKDVGAATVLALVNDYRSENGLEALALDPVLVESAQQRARELADNQYFSHERPGDGSSWATILGRKKKSYKILGENLGRKQTAAVSVIDAWKASPSHNACMLNETFSFAGVGVAKSTAGEFYFVLHFGQR